ncbi:TerC/Alx family metal homeostasis membrane protein [Amycolatopsis taiwanensis]|uniref:LysM domain-containing protein n=1 Tax=Amycolatopsis taiwanensis TaxID=342230 RepID=A0A9W6R9Q9_9PSEU|nr:TerC/Alx family metal homeostasis membrane protein [Amycolatopsis taiwanensis]GLY70830.1 hypothetical protein Atai01_74490 [Amycolatopsis taiwanensis]
MGSATAPSGAPRRDEGHALVSLLRRVLLVFGVSAAGALAMWVLFALSGMGTGSASAATPPHASMAVGGGALQAKTKNNDTSTKTKTDTTKTKTDTTKTPKPKTTPPKPKKASQGPSCQEAATMTGNLGACGGKPATSKPATVSKPPAKRDTQVVAQPTRTTTPTLNNEPRGGGNSTRPVTKTPKPATKKPSQGPSCQEAATMTGNLGACGGKPATPASKVPVKKKTPTTPTLNNEPRGGGNSTTPASKKTPAPKKTTTKKPSQSPSCQEAATMTGNLGACGSAKPKPRDDVGADIQQTTVTQPRKKNTHAQPQANGSCAKTNGTVACNGKVVDKDGTTYTTRCGGAANPCPRRIELEGADGGKVKCTLPKCKSELPGPGADPKKHRATCETTSATAAACGLRRGPDGQLSYRATGDYKINNGRGTTITGKTGVGGVSDKRKVTTHCESDCTERGGGRKTTVRGGGDIEHTLPTGKGAPGMTTCQATGKNGTCRTDDRGKNQYQNCKGADGCRVTHIYRNPNGGPRTDGLYAGSACEVSGKGECHGRSGKDRRDQAGTDVRTLLLAGNKDGSNRGGACQTSGCPAEKNPFKSSRGNADLAELLDPTFQRQEDAKSGAVAPSHRDIASLQYLGLQSDDRYTSKKYDNTLRSPEIKDLLKAAGDGRFSKAELARLKPELGKINGQLDKLRKQGLDVESWAAKQGLLQAAHFANWTDPGIRDADQLAAKDRRVLSQLVPGYDPQRAPTQKDLDQAAATAKSTLNNYLGSGAQERDKLNRTYAPKVDKLAERINDYQRDVKKAGTLDRAEWTRLDKQRRDILADQKKLLADLGKAELAAQRRIDQALQPLHRQDIAFADADGNGKLAANLKAANDLLNGLGKAVTAASKVKGKDAGAITDLTRRLSKAANLDYNATRDGAKGPTTRLALPSSLLPDRKLALDSAKNLPAYQQYLKNKGAAEPLLRNFSKDDLADTAAHYQVGEFERKFMPKNTEDLKTAVSGIDPKTLNPNAPDYNEKLYQRSTALANVFKNEGGPVAKGGFSPADVFKLASRLPEDQKRDLVRQFGMERPDPNGPTAKINALTSLFTLGTDKVKVPDGPNAEFARNLLRDMPGVFASLPFSNGALGEAGARQFYSNLLGKPAAVKNLFDRDKMKADPAGTLLKASPLSLLAPVGDRLPGETGLQHYARTQQGTGTIVTGAVNTYNRITDSQKLRNDYYQRPLSTFLEDVGTASLVLPVAGAGVKAALGGIRGSAAAAGAAARSGLGRAATTGDKRVPGLEPPRLGPVRGVPVGMKTTTPRFAEPGPVSVKAVRPPKTPDPVRTTTPPARTTAREPGPKVTKAEPDADAKAAAARAKSNDWKVRRGILADLGKRVASWPVNEARMIKHNPGKYLGQRLSQRVLPAVVAAKLLLSPAAVDASALAKPSVTQAVQTVAERPVPSAVGKAAPKTEAQMRPAGRPLRDAESAPNAPNKPILPESPQWTSQALQPRFRFDDGPDWASDGARLTGFGSGFRNSLERKAPDQQLAKRADTLDPYVPTAEELRIAAETGQPPGGVRRLNLGAGRNPMPGAANVDLPERSHTKGLPLNEFTPGMLGADAAKLPFPANSFDEVHAINPYEFEPVSPEVAKVLRPGGKLYVSGHPRNKTITPPKDLAGLELAATSSLLDVHRFGQPTRVNGSPLSLHGNEVTYIYRKPSEPGPAAVRPLDPDTEIRPLAKVLRDWDGTPLTREQLGLGPEGTPLPDNAQRVPRDEVATELRQQGHEAGFLDDVLAFTAGDRIHVFDERATEIAGHLRAGRLTEDDVAELFRHERDQHGPGTPVRPHAEDERQVAAPFVRARANAPATPPGRDLALGIRKAGLRKFAEDHGFEHFLDIETWQEAISKVRRVLADETATLHVRLDGMAGDTPEEKLLGAYQRGSVPDRNGQARWFTTEREMYYLGLSIRRGERDWSSIVFYLGDDVVPIARPAQWPGAPGSPGSGGGAVGPDRPRQPPSAGPAAVSTRPVRADDTRRHVISERGPPASIVMPGENWNNRALVAAVAWILGLDPKDPLITLAISAMIASVGEPVTETSATSPVGTPLAPLESRHYRVPDGVLPAGFGTGWELITSPARPGQEILTGVRRADSAIDPNLLREMGNRTVAVNTSNMFGSGFVLGDGLVLTAEHVISGRRPDEIRVNGLPVTRVHQATWPELYGSDFDPVFHRGWRNSTPLADIAILEVPDIKGFAALRVAGDVTAGQEVWWGGYPQHQPVVAAGPVWFDFASHVRIATASAPGASGSAVLAGDGVVGPLAAGKTDTTLVVGPDVLARLLVLRLPRRAKDFLGPNRIRAIESRIDRKTSLLDQVHARFTTGPMAIAPIVLLAKPGGLIEAGFWVVTAVVGAGLAVLTLRDPVKRLWQPIRSRAPPVFTRLTKALLGISVLIAAAGSAAFGALLRVYRIVQRRATGPSTAVRRGPGRGKLDVVAERVGIAIAAAVTIGIVLANFPGRHDQPVPRRQQPPVTQTPAQRDHVRLIVTEVRPRYLKVHPGDMLTRLARGLGIGVNQLAGANPKRFPTVASRDRINPDERFRIPARQRHGRWRVRTGESLGDVADRFGLSRKQILAANPGITQHNLRPGDRLVIHTIRIKRQVVTPDQQPGPRHTYNIPVPTPSPSRTAVPPLAPTARAPPWPWLVLSGLVTALAAGFLLRRHFRRPVRTAAHTRLLDAHAANTYWRDRVAQKRRWVRALVDQLMHGSPELGYGLSQKKAISLVAAITGLPPAEVKTIWRTGNEPFLLIPELAPRIKYLTRDQVERLVREHAAYLDEKLREAGEELAQARIALPGVELPEPEGPVAGPKPVHPGWLDRRPHGRGRLRAVADAARAAAGPLDEATTALLDAKHAATEADVAYHRRRALVPHAAPRLGVAKTAKLLDLSTGEVAGNLSTGLAQLPAAGNDAELARRLKAETRRLRAALLAATEQVDLAEATYRQRRTEYVDALRAPLLAASKLGVPNQKLAAVTALPVNTVSRITGRFEFTRDADLYKPLVDGVLRPVLSRLSWLGGRLPAARPEFGALDSRDLRKLGARLAKLDVSEDAISAFLAPLREFDDVVDVHHHPSDYSHARGTSIARVVRWQRDRRKPGQSWYGMVWFSSIPQSGRSLAAGGGTFYYMQPEPSRRGIVFGDRVLGMRGNFSDVRLFDARERLDADERWMVQPGISGHRMDIPGAGGYVQAMLIAHPGVALLLAETTLEKEAVTRLLGRMAARAVNPAYREYLGLLLAAAALIRGDIDAGKTDPASLPRPLRTVLTGQNVNGIGWRGHFVLNDHLPALRTLLAVNHPRAAASLPERAPDLFDRDFLYNNDFVELLEALAETGQILILHNDAGKARLWPTGHFRKGPPDERNLLPVLALLSRPEFRRPGKQVNVIYAHMGLGKWSTLSHEHLDLIDWILARPELTHIQFDVSWNDVAQHINATPALRAHFVRLVAKHPERFLLGTDSVKPESRPQYLRHYHEMERVFRDIERLTEGEVLADGTVVPAPGERILAGLMHGNAIRLLDDLRRPGERTGLPGNAKGRGRQWALDELSVPVGDPRGSWAEVVAELPAARRDEVWRWYHRQLDLGHVAHPEHARGAGNWRDNAQVRDLLGWHNAVDTAGPSTANPWPLRWHAVKSGARALADEFRHRRDSRPVRNRLRPVATGDRLGVRVTTEELVATGYATVLFGQTSWGRRSPVEAKGLVDRIQRMVAVVERSQLAAERGIRGLRTWFTERTRLGWLAFWTGAAILAHMAFQLEPAATTLIVLNAWAYLIKGMLTGARLAHTQDVRVNGEAMMERGRVDPRGLYREYRRVRRQLAREITPGRGRGYAEIVARIEETSGRPFAELAGEIERDGDLDVAALLPRVTGNRRDARLEDLVVAVMLQVYDDLFRQLITDVHAYRSVPLPARHPQELMQEKLLDAYSVWTDMVNRLTGVQATGFTALNPHSGLPGKASHAVLALSWLVNFYAQYQLIGLTSGLAQLMNALYAIASAILGFVAVGSAIAGLAGHNVSGTIRNRRLQHLGYWPLTGANLALTAGAVLTGSWATFAAALPLTVGAAIVMWLGFTAELGLGRPAARKGPVANALVVIGLVAFGLLNSGLAPALAVAGSLTAMVVWLSPRPIAWLRGRRSARPTLPEEYGLAKPIGARQARGSPTGPRLSRAERRQLAATLREPAEPTGHALFDALAERALAAIAEQVEGRRTGSRTKALLLRYGTVGSRGPPRLVLHHLAEGIVEPRTGRVAYAAWRQGRWALHVYATSPEGFAHEIAEAVIAPLLGLARRQRHTFAVLIERGVGGQRVPGYRRLTRRALDDLRAAPDAELRRMAEEYDAGAVHRDLRSRFWNEDVLRRTAIAFASDVRKAIGITLYESSHTYRKSPQSPEHGPAIPGSSVDAATPPAQPGGHGDGAANSVPEDGYNRGPPQADQRDPKDHRYGGAVGVRVKVVPEPVRRPVLRTVARILGRVALVGLAAVITLALLAGPAAASVAATAGAPAATGLLVPVLLATAGIRALIVRRVLAHRRVATWKATAKPAGPDVIAPWIDELRARERELRTAVNGWPQRYRPAGRQAVRWLREASNAAPRSRPESLVADRELTGLTLAGRRALAGDRHQFATLHRLRKVFGVAPRGSPWQVLGRTHARQLRELAREHLGPAPAPRWQAEPGLVELGRAVLASLATPIGLAVLAGAAGAIGWWLGFSPGTIGLGLGGFAAVGAWHRWSARTGTARWAVVAAVTLAVAALLGVFAGQAKAEVPATRFPAAKKSTVDVWTKMHGQRGESARSIARSLPGTSRRALIAANPRAFDDDGKLRAGTWLRIPHGWRGTVRIAPGYTYWQASKDFRLRGKPIPLGKWLRANEWRPTRLPIGAPMRVPGGKGGPEPHVDTGSRQRINDEPGVQTTGKPATQNPPAARPGTGGRDTTGPPLLLRIIGWLNTVLFVAVFARGLAGAVRRAHGVRRQTPWRDGDSRSHRVWFGVAKHLAPGLSLAGAYAMTVLELATHGVVAAGLLGSTAFFGAFVGVRMLTPLWQRYSWRALALAGMATLAAGYELYTVAHGLVPLLVSAFLVGFGAGGYSPLTDTVARLTQHAARGSRFAETMDALVWTAIALVIPVALMIQQAGIAVTVPSVQALVGHASAAVVAGVAALVFLTMPSVRTSDADEPAATTGNDDLGPARQYRVTRLIAGVLARIGAQITMFDVVWRHLMPETGAEGLNKLYTVSIFGGGLVVLALGLRADRIRARTTESAAQERTFLGRRAVVFLRRAVLAMAGGAAALMLGAVLGGPALLAGIGVHAWTGEVGSTFALVVAAAFLADRAVTDAAFRKNQEHYLRGGRFPASRRATAFGAMNSRKMLVQAIVGFVGTGAVWLTGPIGWAALILVVSLDNLRLIGLLAKASPDELSTQSPSTKDGTMQRGLAARIRARAPPPGAVLAISGALSLLGGAVLAHSVLFLAGWTGVAQLVTIISAGFIGFVAVLATLLRRAQVKRDNGMIGGLGNKGPPSPGRAAKQLAMFVAAALAFGAGAWLFAGPTSAGEFLAGYLTEYTLSVDNLFVFALLIARHRVPDRLQAKALTIGIALAAVFRGVFILLGAVVIAKFSFAFFAFGALLLWKAYTQVRGGGDEAPKDGRLAALLGKVLPRTTEYGDGKLFARVGGKLAATPMLFVVSALGATDLLFALDSIPAIFGITQQPLLVFASNMFALLGLRQLYFLILGLLERLEYLKYGLAAILGFIGAKLMLEGLHIELPGGPLTSLAVIFGVLAITALPNTPVWPWLRAHRRPVVLVVSVLAALALLAADSAQGALAAVIAGGLGGLPGRDASVSLPDLTSADRAAFDAFVRESSIEDTVLSGKGTQLVQLSRTAAREQLGEAAARMVLHLWRDGHGWRLGMFAETLAEITGLVREGLLPPDFLDQLIDAQLKVWLRRRDGIAIDDPRPALLARFIEARAVAAAQEEPTTVSKKVTGTQKGGRFPTPGASRLPRTEGGVKMETSFVDRCPKRPAGRGGPWLL